MTRALCCLLVCAALLLAAGCERHSTLEREGRTLIAEQGCGACHSVPGVRGARGVVGPPLDAFGRRVLVAGKLPNTRRNLALFIMQPQQIEPGTAMPNLEISQEDAVAMAAYLHTLR